MHDSPHHRPISPSTQTTIGLFVSIALLQLSVSPGLVHALPAGAEQQFGQATIQHNGQQMVIHQATPKSIIHWQSFGIAAEESLHLIQPAQGMALYRVIGQDPSAIYGNLNATGRLFLINPNGVLFGQSAQVNVGGLVTSTLNISNIDFLNERFHFQATDNLGSIVNQGLIRAADEGYVVLLAPRIHNHGTIEANNGSVVLGAAQSALLDFFGNGLIKTQLSGDALNALVEHTGSIRGNAATVQLATHARSAAINVSGIIEANSLVERNGVIRLEGGHHARVGVSGVLTVEGVEKNSRGGVIQVTGEQVALFDGAALNASGHSGGGTVLFGGDMQGKNSAIQNARTAFVGQNASVNVSANAQGNGGKAIVWSDATTRFYGNISAKGGTVSGNGGFVEVSGRRYLDFLGKVDLSASQGLGGTFLLDPVDITFNTSTQASPPNNPDGTPDLAFNDGPANTVIQIADITGFSEAFFQATNNITIASPLTMGVNNSIRLEAGNNLNVNAAVTVSGNGRISFIADADSNGSGNLAIGANITSQSGGITLSGATITRTAGNIASTGAGNQHAGNISITSTGATNLGVATISANGGTASTAGDHGRNGGVITINAAGYTGTGAISASGSNGNGANTHGGNAGSVSIASTNGITMGAATVNTNGGNAGTGNGDSGSAGAINIANSASGAITTGALTSRVGVAIGTGAGGTAGSVTVANTAAGNLATGAINTSGNTNSNGNGGTIQLSTVTGNISAGALTSSGGTVLTGNTGKSAGSITVNSGGSYTGTTIAASGTTGLGANQSGGNAANVTINANGGITATTIAASGGNATATNGNGGHAGTVALTNHTSGNITTTTITARNGNAIGTGTGGVAGAINLSNHVAGGTVSTTALSTQGGTLGHGGNISVSALGNVSVNGTINSAGGTSLTGNAGRNAGAVNVSSGANIVTGAITSNASAGLGTNQNGGTGGAVTLTSGMGNTITHTSITSAGAARTGTGIGGNGGNINVSGNSLLSANSTIDAMVGTGGVASGNITFGGTINSSGANRTLAINTTGATMLNGAIGNTLALTSLTTNAGGTTAINGGSVTTTGGQTYSDNVTLGAATTLSTTNSNVTFTAASSVVNTGGNNLTIAAGTGAVSATNATNNFGNLAITAGSANIRDTNAIALGATNVSGAYTLQTNGAITQTGAVTVGGATSINAGAGSDVTLNNAANNFNSIAVTNGRDVNIVDTNALTVNVSSVRTLSAQTLSGNLTLGGNITATGTGSSTSITLATAQNFLNTGNFNLTPGIGSRWLVYSTSPLSDTRGANLLAAYDFKQYNTAFGGPILGSNDGFIYSLAPIISATLSGSASKVYDGTTVAAIGGLTLGQSGAIDGDTVNLSALTSATYDNRNVGVNKTVTSNTISVTSASNGVRPVFGYQVSGSVATGNVGTITQRAITVAAATDTKTYDGNNSSAGTPTVTSGSIVAGDTGSFSQAFDNRNAGTGKMLTAGGSVNDGNSGNNYAVTFVANNTGIINPLALTVSSQTANNKVYDTTIVATLSGGTLSGILGSDTVNLVAPAQAVLRIKT